VAENGYTNESTEQWWVDKIIIAIFPTKKMTLNLHNHFVLPPSKG
jgi:hypothetical protein